MLKREIWVGKILPGLILFSLWLDGWFFPLILLPLLYVLFIEKKSLKWLGFSSQGLRVSILISSLIFIVLSIIYYPIFLHYLPLMEGGTFDLYSIFSDIIQYPVYEEIAYRGFALTHFAEFDDSYYSTRNLIVNLLQSLFFLSIHKHHLGKPMVLIPVFLLGVLNGFLFLKTRNIYSCILSHSSLNGFALLLRYISA